MGIRSLTDMAGGLPGERLRLARQLAEVREGFRDAARRRSAARTSGDLVAESQAQTAIEAAFRTREHILRRAVELGCLDETAGAGRPSGT